MKMTLTNESVTFTSHGIYIQPVLGKRFKFAGSPEELISIMINHPELDIETCYFRVMELSCRFCRGECTGVHYISPSTFGY